MSWLSIGNAEIGRVVESVGPFQSIYDFFPDATPELLAPHLSWLEPDALEPGTDKLVFPIQSYVVRTPRYTLLVDSCVGNHKTVKWFDEWHNKTDNNYLAGLAKLGLRPEDIDYVMCTHLHVDHSGWNTRLVDGKWVPTFPNARYVLSRTEVAAAEAMYNKFKDPVYLENVQPILEAGQADLVDDDHELDECISLEPTPGHTLGHCAVRVNSREKKGIITGDLIHSPIQCHFPHWNFQFDADAERAGKTRQAFLARYSDCDTKVMTAHFPLPSAGYIRSQGDAYHFHYEA